MSEQWIGAITSKLTTRLDKVSYYCYYNKVLFTVLQMPLNAKTDLLQRIEKQFHPNVVGALVQNTIQSVRKVTPNEVSYACGISLSTL